MFHQSDNAIEPEYVFQHRIVVKFVDHFEHDENYQIPYEDGAEESFPDDMKKYWYSLAEQYPEITLKRLYTSVSGERIQELVAEAQRQNKDYEAPNFFTFFAVNFLCRNSYGNRESSVWLEGYCRVCLCSAPVFSAYYNSKPKIY